jgi:hypothetical protein
MPQTGQTGSITGSIKSYRALPKGGLRQLGVVLCEGAMIMEKFIHDENLKLFRNRLAETTDEAQRDLILALIKEEEAKAPPIRLSKIKAPD